MEKQRTHKHLMDKRLENITGKIEAALDQFLITFINAVFVLDAHHIIIACGSESRKELCPIHITETGQAWHLPAHALRKHTVVIESFIVDVQIFGMDVNNLACK